jgi:hypothetical protein
MRSLEKAPTILKTIAEANPSGFVVLNRFYLGMEILWCYERFSVKRDRRNYEDVVLSFWLSCFCRAFLQSKQEAFKEAVVARFKIGAGSPGK